MPQKTLSFKNGRHLASLYGSDPALKAIGNTFTAKLVVRDADLIMDGPTEALEQIEQFFDVLEKGKAQGMTFQPTDIDNLLHLASQGEWRDLDELFQAPEVIKLRNDSYVAKTLNQKRYIKAIRRSEVVFGVGPAGTGKTFLAVALAMEALMAGSVKKVVLTRPAVEAGEALGFLPGDLEEKILPYLRPLYDAMDIMIGKDNVTRMMEKGTIEIAPLAYMRGRTLQDSFIVLDEAQNTTPEQMMMFLTRLGEGSKMVVTGDITQIDLPRSKVSGLKQSIEVLENVEGIGIFHFGAHDVVRHSLVQRIINAYDRYKQANALR